MFVTKTELKQLHSIRGGRDEPESEILLNCQRIVDGLLGNTRCTACRHIVIGGDPYIWLLKLRRVLREGAPGVLSILSAGGYYGWPLAALVDANFVGEVRYADYEYELERAVTHAKELGVKIVFSTSPVSLFDNPDRAMAVVADYDPGVIISPYKLDNMSCRARNYFEVSEGIYNRLHGLFTAGVKEITLRQRRQPKYADVYVAESVSVQIGRAHV